jgi:thiol-disulfide isomerase/thioredoxin
MIKKSLSLITFVLIGLTIVAPFFASAQTPKLEINFFYSETCPHCMAENAFLDKISPDYPDVKINRYLITDTSERQLLINSLKKGGNEKYLGLVPITFVGNDFFLGFDSETVIGQQIIDSIKKQIDNPNANQDNENKGIIKLPIIGTVDLTKYSLLMQAVSLGFFDGFNVCSLGALVMILGLVLILKSRPRIILFGGLYIFITSLVYGLLIFLWYQLFYYLGPLVPVMNVFVGILGIAGAVYFLRQFLKSRKADLTCTTQENKIVAKHSLKIQEAFKKSGGVWGLIIGVIIFASVITIVEFPCSAVIPVLFAGVMAHAKLSLLGYILHLLVYLLFYMLDEIVVFLIAVFTMNVKIASGKTMKWLSLIEAIVLLTLGIHYLRGLF